jgi:spermidine synthase
MQSVPGPKAVGVEPTFAAENPIRWYGFLEILIGIYAILFIGAFHLFDLLFGAISSAFQSMESLRILLTALLILIILLPPTCAMGATLPLLVKHFTKKFSDFKINISLFYAINTLGAAIGVLIAGFFLIEKTGISNGILLTGGFNIAIGLCALLIWRKYKNVSAETEVAERKEKAKKRSSFVSPVALPATHLQISKTFLLVTAFLSGFIALSYEIIWTRALKFLIQSSTYSFTIILFVFLLGIAIGGRIAERWMKEKNNLVNRYGQLQLFLSVTSLFTVWFLYRLAYTDFFQQKIFDVIFDYSFGWFSGVIVYAFVCGIVFLLSTIIMGILFPLLNQIFFTTGAQLPGKAVSKVYVINTAGSIAGALAAGQS